MIKKAIVIFGIAGAISIHLAFAATTSTITKGERALQDMINAESARVAELNVQLDPKQGITHTLQKKSIGNDVKLLQQFLKVYGVYPKGLITGYFGPLTEAAVKKFQQKEGLDIVGIAGPKTRTRIKEISRKQTAAVAVTATSKTSSSSTPIITDVLLTASIADNGSAASAANTFASTTQNIYAVLSLKNISQDAQIACVRYYQGNYVDSEVSHPSRSGLAYFHFQWSLKPGTYRTPGNYSLVFYLNGKGAKTIQYSIY